MSLFKTIGTPVTLALVLISSGALTAHACNPKPNSCCWEEGGTGWLTCSGECVDLKGAGLSARYGTIHRPTIGGT
jgi:hypothetical protein